MENRPIGTMPFTDKESRYTKQLWCVNSAKIAIQKMSQTIKIIKRKWTQTYNNQYKDVTNKVPP